MIALIFIYLIGCVYGYLSYKKDMLSEFNQWTVSDRKIGLALSIFSWVCVFAGWIIQQKQNDKPASW